MSDSLNRRQFLGTTAAGSVLMTGQLGARPLVAAEDEGWPKPPPVRIYKIYVGRTGAVTCAKFINNDTMLISTGKIFKVTHDELGCRTQFWTEVEDARSMFLNWGGGVLKGGTMTLLHRVVFYGNHIQAIQDLATLMGTKVVLEV